MKTISVREFLRGAYRTIDEPVLVMSHSKPIGVWDPTTTSVSVNYSNTTSYFDFGSARGVWKGPTSSTTLRYDEGE